MLATSTQQDTLIQRSRKLPPHLVKRGDIFYFRLAIPKDLRHEFPHHEIKYSLKTSSLRAAKLLAAAYETESQSLFASLRSKSIKLSTERLYVMPTTEKRLESPKDSDSPLLSQVIEDYIAEKKPSWRARTEVEFTSALNLMLTTLGDQQISQITRIDCISCRDRLLNGSERTPSSTATSRAPKTVNQYIRLLSSVFKLAVDQGVLFKNPAERLTLPLSIKPMQQRNAYSPAQIQLILKNLPEQSCDYPERYWMPVIALYSGLRREEIAQLSWSDIIEKDGIACFDINGEHLKTKTSTRLVPVHPELIKLGFLDYVENTKMLSEDRADTAYLFPAINTDRYGRRGRWFGEWYSKFLRENIGLNDPKLTFHSFRHTFATALKHAEVDGSMMAELLGHTMHGETFGRYAKSYPPAMLYEAISKVNFTLP